MRFIPTHCEICCCSALVPSDAIIDGHAKCRACGNQARSLPGESYAAEDAALFRELDAVLREAALTPLHAAQLALQLDARNRDEPGRGLQRLVQVLPSLGMLELVAVGPARRRKAEGMLAILFDALARGRSQSGIMRAVDANLPSKTSNGHE